MVKQCRKLRLHGFQISWLKRFSIRCFKLHNRILPFDNVSRTDLIHLLLLEIWQNPVAEYGVLRLPGIQFQLGLKVILINPVKRTEIHIQTGCLLESELLLPLQCLLTGLKTSFQLPSVLTCPIIVVKGNIPCSSFFILVSSHLLHSPSLSCLQAIELLVKILTANLTRNGSVSLSLKLTV